MTFLGYILLPIGLAGLCLSTKWLYRLFVFSTLFSASAVMNFGEGEHASALQVWMFFGFLWLLRLLVEHLSTLSFSINRRIVRPCLWLIAFLLIASFSLIMPVYINGSLAITSPYLGDETQTPLYLTSHNFTQLLYLIFGVTIAICVAHSNLREVERHDTERVILFSALFISVWGLFQFFCNLTGIPYPDYILNNSGSSSAKGFMQTLGIGVNRITSATLEPSVLAMSLISVLPLTLPAWLRRGSVLSINVDRSATALFVVLLILSTSSTAYLGLFVLAVLIWCLLLRTRTMSMGKATWTAVIVGVCALSTAAIALASIPIAREVVSAVLLDKSSSGSALERAMTVALAFGYFQKYPILGIGWGSATSHDLIVYLLANVGIVGAFTLFGAMISVLRAGWRALDVLVLPEGLSRAAWFVAFAAFLSSSLFVEFPLSLGNFWLVLGMAISTGLRVERRQRPILTEK